MAISLHVKIQRSAVQAADNLRKRMQIAGFWMPCGGISPLTQWFTCFVVNKQQTSSLLYILIGRSTCRESWISMSPCSNLFCCWQRFHQPPHADLSTEVWWVSPNTPCIISEISKLVLISSHILKCSRECYARGGVSDGFDVINMIRRVCFRVKFNRIILFHVYRMFSTLTRTSTGRPTPRTRTINV